MLDLFPWTSSVVVLDASPTPALLWGSGGPVYVPHLPVMAHSRTHHLSSWQWWAKHCAAPLTELSAPVSPPSIVIAYWQASLCAEVCLFDLDWVSTSERRHGIRPRVWAIIIHLKDFLSHYRLYEVHTYSTEDFLDLFPFQWPFYLPPFLESDSQMMCFPTGICATLATRSQPASELPLIHPLRVSEINQRKYGCCGVDWPTGSSRPQLQSEWNE